MVKHPPVLVVADVLQPQLCRDLIGAFATNGGTMAPAYGLAVNGQDIFPTTPGLKQRADIELRDQALIGRVAEAFNQRLLPQIYQAFAYRVTRIERYLVGCYDAADGGHFGPHRDNVYPYTAHRRFALTLALNDNYEGGALRFPDWDCEYRLPAGHAIVFSCALLHEATVVTKGKRYAFLTFFYDEEGQRLREAVAVQTQMLTADGHGLST